VTKLDDFLGPLHEGVWEVVVPKDTVSEPLDTGWKKSGINVPSPGTLASYRKARYHVHETKTEWRVHLDRYDPKANPLLHLIDDAPLILMISDTFMTLILDTRRTEQRNTEDVLTTQRFLWQEQVIAGLVSGFTGFFIAGNPALFFSQIFELIIPLAITCLAVMVLARAIHPAFSDRYRAGDLYRGTGILCAGIFAFFLPIALWVVLVLAVLAFWMIASAGMLLVRVMKGRQAVPEGFYSRMAIGILSLAAAVLLLLNPFGILLILMEILGAVTLLLGVTLCINGLRLRTWMRQTPGG
jgi:uncharacterized membrane protein HdeD (DUF308 family)